MRATLTRFAGGLLVAMLLAGGIGRAQMTGLIANHADPEVTRLFADTVVAMNAIGLAGGVTVFTTPIVGSLIIWHDVLTLARAEADANVLAALYTGALNEQDRQIRGAVLAGNRLVLKLREDIAYYETRRPHFRSGTPPTAMAERNEFAIYTEIKARLQKVDRGGEIDVVGKGERLLARFDEMRQTVIRKGLGSRIQLVANAKGVTPALTAFADAVRRAEGLVESKLKLGPDMEVNASPMQQMRAVIENNSATSADDGALVFFVRVWNRSTSGTLRDCSGDYELPLGQNADGTPKQWTNQDGTTGEWRDDSWTVVWPKDARFESTGPPAPGATLPQDIRLPSRVALSVGLGSRIELRVATYGDLRKRIRFQDVVGRVVRPEMSSLPRSFYWFAYEAIQTDGAGGGGNLKSRWFPTRESYTWTLSGAWSDLNAGPLKARLESTSGDARRTTPLRPYALDAGAESLLTLVNDRAVYCLPRSLDLILSDPFMSALVQGETDVRHVTQTNTTGQTQRETGKGEIGITIQRW